MTRRSRLARDECAVECHDRGVDRPLAHLIALIAPPRCGICSSPCGVAEPVCEDCREALAAPGGRWASVPGVELSWSAVAYDGVARDLIAALKFGGRLALARVAATAMVDRLPPDLASGEVVPVPAAPARRRSRGFDSAEAIAASLSDLTGLPLTACLRRTGGPRQVGRARAQRIADPPCVSVTREAPSRALLVDDVLTTGATLHSCAAALRTAGTEKILAVTFAGA